MLGKRKRETRVVARPTASAEASQSTSQPAGDLLDVFRQHFEAAFDPLSREPESAESAESDGEGKSDESSDVESHVSEWSGLSECGEENLVVEVIDPAVSHNGRGNEYNRAGQKAFMSSRPPRDREGPGADEKTPKAKDGGDPAEKLNLKQDIDLQRLLRESHLLEKAKQVDGRNGAKQRQMALDMRLQALGAKKSLFAQEKMPAAHRRGILKKAEQTERRRRREAKENGVILEKAAPKKVDNKKRVRGVDGPGVGRFSGGTLKLSRRDVASIQGPPTSTGRKGKRR